MLFFYNYANYFLEYLSEVGNFLLNKPLSFVADWFDTLSNIVGIIVPPWVKEGWMAIADTTLAEYILGVGLTFILSYKLIKFFTDIVL